MVVIRASVLVRVTYSMNDMCTLWTWVIIRDLSVVKALPWGVSSTIWSLLDLEVCSIVGVPKSPQVPVIC